MTVVTDQLVLIRSLPELFPFTKRLHLHVMFATLSVVCQESRSRTIRIRRHTVEMPRHMLRATRQDGDRDPWSGPGLPALIRALESGSSARIIHCREGTRLPYDRNPTDPYGEPVAHDRHIAGRALLRTAVLRIVRPFRGHAGRHRPGWCVSLVISAGTMAGATRSRHVPRRGSIRGGRGPAAGASRDRSPPGPAGQGLHESGRAGHEWRMLWWVRSPGRAGVARC